MRPRERRGARRFARRAQVRYWVRGEPRPRSAFVHDISHTGVFVATPYPLPKGTEIRIEILDRGTSYMFEAIVARRVWIAPDLRKLGPSGMGLRFLSTRELVERVRARGRGRPSALGGEDGIYRIVLEDDLELLKAYADDIEQGGLFVPTEDPPELNRRISLDFRFPEDEEPLRAEARVVQRVPPGQTPAGLAAGMAVIFEQPEAVLDRLRPYLERDA